MSCFSLCRVACADVLARWLLQPTPASARVPSALPLARRVSNVTHERANARRRHAHQSVVLGVNNTIPHSLHHVHARTHAKSTQSRSQLFSMKNGMAHACIEASSGSPPDVAPRRLRAPPAAPWLRTSRSRLHLSGLRRRRRARQGSPRAPLGRVTLRGGYNLSRLQ